MTIDNVLEILEKHKLRIPSNVFYELKADIVNFEEPTTKNDAPENNVGNIEPTTKNDLGVDREDAVVRLNALKHLIGYDKDSEIVKATQKSLDMAIKALEQEPSKPMVEIDLYSVIKQKYIEREVLDKIRAEIIKLKVKDVMSYVTGERRMAFEWTKHDILKIIDKYKAETEAKDGNDRT